MWFKQARIFQMDGEIPYDSELLEQDLFSLTFQPCFANSPSSHGWVNPIEQTDEEHECLVHCANGYLLIAMKIEEKVLPSSVVRQVVNDEIKKIEKNEKRKVSQKEKSRMIELTTDSYLPKAFSKYSYVHAFINPKDNLLIVDTTSEKKLKKFFDLFETSLSDVDCR